MATNWGDALLIAVRNALAGVTGLPTLIPSNTTAQPAATAPFVADQLVNIDTQYRELGPSSWQRTTATYRVTVRQPVGIDAFDASAVAAAISDKFASVASAGTLKVSSTYPVELLASRIGPSVEEPSWLAVPVTLSLTFDHP